MGKYIVGFCNGYEMERVLFQTDSLKAAKKWATRHRDYDGHMTAPGIYTRLPDGRVVLAAFGEYNRQTKRIKWKDVY